MDEREKRDAEINAALKGIESLINPTDAPITTTTTTTVSDDEIDELVHGPLRYDMIWLGGIRDKDGHGWQWLDGRAWTYQKWGYMQPSSMSGEDCLYLLDGSWSSSECSQ